ncbi:KilA, N- domain-containing protein [Salmonella enterica subsp. enterica]|uniref:KilA, N- domain-containing protein n=1 Tax=Salmonella enterica I TaxID=59201 RepID=A0A379WE55_SALET|nr:KilA, N- domain-containing protein [Salmonella enterica subsp. enterica]
MIHQRFNVESIEELDASQIPKAVEYIHRVVLEGEFIGKQEKKTNELSAKEANSLVWLWIMPTAHRHYSANCIRR